MQRVSWNTNETVLSCISELQELSGSHATINAASPTPLHKETATQYERALHVHGEGLPSMSSDPQIAYPTAPLNPWNPISWFMLWLLNDVQVSPEHPPTQALAQQKAGGYLLPWTENEYN